MEGKFIRPANASECFLETTHQQGTLLTCYWLCLGSKEVLQPDSVLQTLRHLFRKIPTLRTCFKRKNDELWVCEMNEEKIDFEVDNNTSHEAIFENLSSYHYNSSEGPVWCVRMKQQELKIEGVDYENDFQKQTHIFIGFHHSITDGVSNIKICNHFMQYLNDIIRGVSIDDLEQLCSYDDGRISNHIIGEIEEEFTSNPIKYKQTYEKYLQHHTHDPILSKLNKGMITEKPRTMNIQKALSKDKSMLLLKKCKEHGVSVNSCFTAVANIAYGKFLRELGVDQEININVNHIINQRRYWHGATSKMFGPHIGYIMKIYEIKHEANFWEYAKDIHKDFYESLENKTTYKNAYIRRKNPNDPSPKFDYGVSNMGNLSNLLDEDGKNVRLYRIVRTTSNHILGSVCAQNLTTFRGKIFYGIDYVTELMSPQIAEMNVKNIFNIIDEIIK